MSNFRQTKTLKETCRPIYIDDEFRSICKPSNFGKTSMSMNALMKNKLMPKMFPSNVDEATSSHYTKAHLSLLFSQAISLIRMNEKSVKRKGNVSRNLIIVDNR